MRPRRETFLNNVPGRLCALLPALALLAACSSNLRDVYGEPPQAGLDGMERRADGVVVELALRNVNDEALRLAGTSLTLTLDGKPLVDAERELPLSISARGREVMRLILPADPAGLERLDALSDRQVERLPWSMEARLRLAGGGTRLARADGWLHRVPGQPDRFR